MSVFVICSTTIAAGLAVAFEVGRVAEKRLSGSSKLSLPFEGFDWKSENAKTAAYIFIALFFVEICFLPRFLNPFSYLTDETSFSSYSSLLAFVVFGSWSGILAVGFGGIAASFQALNMERMRFDSERSNLESSHVKTEEELEVERQKIAKAQRTNLASAAAVAGEWKKLHIAREDDLHRGMERSENEKIWSKTIAKEFDKKVMRVVDNATDKRWREIEDQDLTLEAMRFRNKEKEKRLKKQRAMRAERASSEKETLKNEASKLLQMTDEFEGLESTMEKLKEENKKKEQEKIRELKERETALTEKEKVLEESHLQKLEKLQKQEQKLKSKEEEFDSGEKQKKLQELSEKLESSKLTVAKFNEEVMKNEKQKLEEFRKREVELKKREEKLNNNVAFKYIQGLNDEIDEEDKSVSIRLLTERVIHLDSSTDVPSKNRQKIGEDAQPDKSKSDMFINSHSVEKNREEVEKTFPVSLMDLDDDEDAAKDEKVQIYKTISTRENNQEHDVAIVDKRVEEVDDDESTESSYLLNANDDFKAVEHRNEVSDNESLSHQIQRDIATEKREELWNADFPSSNAYPEYANVPAPLSPSQKNFENNFFKGNTASKKKKTAVETRMDTIPMFPTLDSFKEAITINPTSSDRNYVVSNKVEQENATSQRVRRKKKTHRKAFYIPKSSKDKKSFVVSEESAVEVIAWSDPGPF